MDDPPFYGESEDEEDEEAYDLREVSSDVEMNPDEIGSDDDRLASVIGPTSAKFTDCVVAASKSCLTCRKRSSAILRP